jgi:putative sporulation protein YtaF
VSATITVQAILLAIALSLDSLGTGFAYGMRRLTLPTSTYLLLAAATGLLMTFSMLAGASLMGPAHAALASALGRTALLGVGLWQIHRGWHQYLALTTRAAPGRPLATFRLRPLGVLVQVLHDPTRADLDRSGRLDPGESALLGLALGLDAFAAGFGTGMLGFPLQVVPTVAVACPLLLAAGTALGRRITTDWFSRRGFALPGLIICTIALLKRTR